MSARKSVFRVAAAALAAVIALAVAGCAGATEPASAGEVEVPMEGRTVYESTRFTIDTGQQFDEFIAAFEQAVPPFTPDLVVGVADWAEAQERVADAAPHGFLTYAKLAPRDTMAISGVGRDHDQAIAYLMGNHTIAETMYRHDPGVMLYAPLHVNIIEAEDGDALFLIDRPSDQFGSFGVDEIGTVGLSLDDKVTELLTALGVQVPAGWAE